MICPDHRWWECRHPELANRPLGIALMVVGVVQALVGTVLIMVR